MTETLTYVALYSGYLVMSRGSVAARGHKCWDLQSFRRRLGRRQSAYALQNSLYVANGVTHFVYRVEDDFIWNTPDNDLHDLRAFLHQRRRVVTQLTVKQEPGEAAVVIIFVRKRM